MHVPKETRRKWDAKSVKCIFIGCSIYRKGYRLWNPASKQVYESRDVTFLETDFHNRVTVPKSVKPNSVTTVIQQFMDTENDISENTKTIDNASSQNSTSENASIRRSTRVTRPPDRGGTITENWWEVENVLYTFADEILKNQDQLKKH